MAEPPPKPQTAEQEADEMIKQGIYPPSVRQWLIDKIRSRPQASTGDANDPRNWPVFKGYTTRTLTGDPDRPKVTGRTPAMWNTAEEALMDFYTWDEKKRADFAKKLGTPGASSKELADAWGQFVLEAAKYTKAGQNVSPWDIMASYMGDTLKAKSKQPKVDLGGTVSQTQTSFSITDPQTASIAIDRLLQQRLGRKATPGERQAFVEALNVAERKSPTTTTTVTTRGGTGVQDPTKPTQEDVSTTTASRGGVQTGAFAEDYVDRNFFAEESVRTAATTYFDAWLSILGLGGPVGR